MPFIPVDTAVQLIVGPLIDDTDFKTLETGVVYNATGMAIDLIESSITGVPTKTDLTLTTGGTSDWGELGNGMYYVEITAAQNNTLGELQLIGIATGILPFISAKYQVVPVAVYNSLVAGSDNLQVDTIQWLGTACATPSVAGVPEVDITHVAGSTTSVSVLATNVATIVSGVTVTTNNDKTGYALSAAGVDAIWDEATAGHVTAGTFGASVLIIGVSYTHTNDASANSQAVTITKT